MKLNFYHLIIIVLIGVIILQRMKGCQKGSEAPKSDTTTIVDTFLVIERDTVYLSSPAIVKTIPGKVPEFITNDTSCEAARVARDVLASNYFATNIQSQKFRKGNSWLELTDTVRENKIIGRRAVYELETVTVKETNTVTNTIIEQKRQFYLGGGISGNKKNLVSRFELGLLYKDRKDRMFGVKADLDVTGQISYGVQSYWKIRLR